MTLWDEEPSGEIRHLRELFSKTLGWVVYRFRLKNIAGMTLNLLFPE